MVCKDIINFIIRHKENDDLDRRLTEVEKLLAEKKFSTDFKADFEKVVV